MPDDTMDRPNRQTDWLTDLIRQTLSVPISNADRVLTGRSQCLRPTFYVRTFVQAHNEREQRTTKCSGAWNNNLLHKNRRQLNIRKIFSVCATATGFFYIQDTRDYVAASVCGTDWLGKDTFCWHKSCLCCCCCLRAKPKPFNWYLWLPNRRCKFVTILFSWHFFLLFFSAVVDWKHKNYW